MSQGVDAFANFDEGNDDGFMVGNSASNAMDTPGAGFGEMQPSGAAAGIQL